MRWWTLFSISLCILCVPSLAFGSSGTKPAAAERLQQDYPGVRLATLGQQVDRVYGTAFGFGDSPEVSAEHFVASYAGLFGVAAADLSPGNTFNERTAQRMIYDAATDAYKFTLVYYRQYYEDIPVYGAELRLLTRNEAGYPLVLASSSLRDLGDFSLAAGALEAANFGLAQEAAVAAVPGLVNFEEPELVIWAGIDDMLVEPALAYAFIADNGVYASSDEARWLFVVDALDGTVLYQENQILHVDIEGTVMGKTTLGHDADICNFVYPRTMPYARVVLGSTVVYADEFGDFTIPHEGADPVVVQSEVRGLYFQVFNQGGPNGVIEEEVVPPGPVSIMHNPVNAGNEFGRAELNAYLHANIVRDFALAQNPDYPVIAGQLAFPVNVNIDNSCNAYYNGWSINFFRASGSCANTAFGTVVHHEYGHHLVNVGGSGQGQYGEGMSDCMSMLISDDPQLGRGFFLNCGVGIRNADNTYQYPCDGQIHDCGQLLSGAVWSTYQELLESNPDTARDIVAGLTVNSILLHTGNLITPQIAIDFVTLDDNDAYLSNGTPHYPEINAAFSAHNMDPPELNLLQFDFPTGRPELASPVSGTPVQIEVSEIDGMLAEDSLQLLYDAGAGWEATALSNVAPGTYEALLPAGNCGDTIRYYFSAETVAGMPVTEPSGAPLGAYSVLVGDAIATVLSDDFETDQGWSVVNEDTLWDGAWERGVPADGGLYGGPATDYDGSGSCYVTDNAADGADVDYGWTRLVSPPLNLLGGKTQIEYALWYTNDFDYAPHNDVFRVEISNDGGGSWTLVHEHGPVTDAGWNLFAFEVSEHVAPTADMLLRFEASDESPASVVEAAIDAVRVVQADCGTSYPLGDMNCDGLVSFDDVAGVAKAMAGEQAFYQSYPDCIWMNADCNGDGVVDFDDIAAFIDLL